jgi:multiple antibiotic resistance protein
MSLLSATVLLFFVMDPLGNIPLFLLALRDVPAERRTRVVVRDLLVALGVLLLFLFAGSAILRGLGVSQPALTISGGVVLLLIAIRMIFPSPIASLRETVESEPFIFPLAIPYVAGPSVMATELLLMTRDPGRWPVWVSAILLAWLASAIILLSAGTLRRVLGERALTALERLMGMLLVMLAVEMLMQGIAQFRATL